MFINTCSKEKMEESIVKILDISRHELNNLFHIVNQEVTKNGYTDGCILDKLFEDFLESNNSIRKIDEILFFHLTRRLDKSQDNSILNLRKLLTTSNRFSDFLEKYDISFNKSNNHLELCYKNKLFPLKNSNDDITKWYLQSRLGYNINEQDYCVNGFAFKDLLHKNSYTQSLYICPEFIEHLSKLIRRPELLNDFFNKSKFYCLTYCVPIDKIIFDEDENIKHKDIFLITKILSRLYYYRCSSIEYMHDNDNPILRLTDFDNMRERYLLSKEAIKL
jgi:hypothetical protein